MRRARMVIRRARKTGIPFVAHILGVTAIALEYGANETEAIGALLHDTVEDCGGAERLRDIREKFGNDVGQDRRWMHRHIRDTKAAVVGTKTLLY